MEEAAAAAAQGGGGGGGAGSSGAAGVKWRAQDTVLVATQAGLLYCLNGWNGQVKAPDF
jgi:hypothetical protein